MFNDKPTQTYDLLCMVIHRIHGNTFICHQSPVVCDSLVVSSLKYFNQCFYDPAPQFYRFSFTFMWLLWFGWVALKRTVLSKRAAEERIEKHLASRCSSHGLLERWAISKTLVVVSLDYFRWMMSLTVTWAARSSCSPGVCRCVSSHWDQSQKHLFEQFIFSVLIFSKPCCDPGHDSCYHLGIISINHH